MNQTEMVSEDQFAGMVADRLIELVLMDVLPSHVEEAVESILKHKKAGDILDKNLRHIRKYRLLLQRRFREMEREVLAKIRKPKKDVYHGAKGRWVNKEKFDVNEWLFNRLKWRGILTEDGKLMTAKPLKDGGKELMEEIGVGTSFDETDPRAIEWIATNAKNAAWSISNTIYNRLRTQLMEAIAAGESIPKIRERVMDLFENIRVSKAELIARTEVLKASNRGRFIAMKQSGVVEGKEWLATGDQRTCPMCAEMDGATMPLEKPFFKQGESHTFTGTSQTPAPEGGIEAVFDYEEIQHPPLHPDCRCTLLAIVKEV